MPHHIRASDIAMDERRPHMVVFANRVKAALMDPSLPERRRQKLKAQLERIRAELQAHGEADG